MALELVGSPHLDMKSPWAKGGPPFVLLSEEPYGELTIVVRVGMEDVSEMTALLELLGWTHGNGVDFTQVAGGRVGRDR